ncbi:MAG: dynamin family protein, partial [Xenococcus sp. (in: cyanobacteria)]
MSYFSTVTQEQLDYGFLLLIHIICAYKKIDSEELKYLKELSDPNNISQQTKDEIDKIYIQDRQHITLDHIANSVSVEEQSQIMEQILAIFYEEDLFGLCEEDAIEHIASTCNWSQKAINRIVKARGFIAQSNTDNTNQSDTNNANQSNTNNQASVKSQHSQNLIDMEEIVEAPVINLQPNIQDLQGDVLDLLKDISKLIRRAKNDLSNNNSGNKYGEAQQEVEQAIRNVENLELRMAIVAPMKAGKSTIINAIVGQDLLPSRNAAMTTIPTKISFNDSVDKPVLILAENTLSVFKHTWESLHKKMNSLEESEIESSIGQYPHLKELAREIKNNSFYISSEVVGKDNISLVLTKLNDIVRLCCTLDPSKDPLDKLEDVPNIQTPFWRNDNTEQSEQLGNLVVVDTPGPNEAGDNLRLTAVVEQELRRCSIVLIVLDFTQLNNQAAEGVKQQVQPIIDLIGKDNLYVLVNKVDQRRNGDMTPDDVKKFVYSDLNLSEAEDSERIFEISARQAFSATKFLLELQQNPDLELPNMSSIEALAKEVLGNRWERKLQKQTKEDLQEEAEYLWEDSGFNQFIINSIQALIASAAPKCMLSAINRSHNLLTSLKDDLSLRAKAISQDAEKLELEINALNTDLQHLEICRSRLKTVDEIKIKLQNNLNEILKTLVKQAKISIESHFK